jgi:tetratricopeptide (TPR) repeat protein
MKTLPSLLLRLRSGMCPSLNKTFVVSGLLTALIVSPVYADDLADVTKAVRAGQYADALSKADAFLAKHPRDAQMRFLKGVILTEQGKSAEAIGVFTKLTEDYPELPEPYNNLAVLFAANGQFDKARIALDAAIRTNPAYATAYENLGDVHAKLASQAYDKALQLDSGNANAKSKLTLLRTLAGSSATGTKVSAVATPATVATSTPVAAPVAVAAASKPVVQEPAKAMPAVASAAPAAKPAETPKAAKTVERDDEREEVLAAVHGWAKAWSEQDVKSYLNYYAGDFETPKGEARKEWAEERHQRIEGKGRIEVKVESPQISVNGNTATVKFRQIYTSDRLKADSHKVLTLTKQGGKWQIKQEHSGS